MGRIHDALKKAQEERERKRAEKDSASAVPPRPVPPSVTPESRPRTPVAPTVEMPLPDEPGVAVEDLRTVESPPRRKEEPRRSFLPEVRPPEAKPVEKRARVLTMGELPQTSVGLGETLVSWTAPADPRAEQFRVLRANIGVLPSSPVVLAVSSSLRGEGANLTAANLGVCFAEGGAEKVLLVDADLRDPRLGGFFGTARETPGLADALSGRVPIEQVVRETGIPGLSIVPSGPSVANPGALISGPRLQQLFTQWRKSYHRVIIVTPPVSLASDASVIGHEVDGAVLVVKLGVTPRRTTERSIEILSTSGVKLLGCVLTNSGRSGDAGTP